MRRHRTLAAAAAVAVAGAMLLALTPPDGSDAQWQESDTVSVTGPNSDTFNMSATNVDFPAPVWTGAAGSVSNSPRLDVVNESTRHSSWVNVHSTRVKKAVTSDSNNILSQMALEYEYGEGTCQSTLGTYWEEARLVGQITENTTYPRMQNKVAIGTLAPGQKRSLCPAVRLNYKTSTVEGQRDALLKHAGRALDITTIVNQKSESPATWASEPRTVTSRYRISMPAPTTPSGNPVCRRTFSSGTPAGGGLFGGFFWGWPDAGTSADPTTTPAMAGGWEILRQSATGDWQFFAEADNNDRRRRAGINSNDLHNDGQPSDEVRKFKLRGYPFAGDKTRYVESEWIAQAHERAGRWACDSPLSNPDAGPHNMP